MLKNNKIYRVLSFIVTIVFILASVPVQEVRAAEGDPDTFVITSFDKADEWKMEKTTFEPGTEIKDMQFPTEWLVKGYLKADEAKTEQEKKLESLVWEGYLVTEKETEDKVPYEKKAENGEYLFTPKLPEGFETEEEVKLPSQKILIKAEVKEEPKPEEPPKEEEPKPEEPPKEEEPKPEEPPKEEEPKPEEPPKEEEPKPEEPPKEEEPKPEEPPKEEEPKPEEPPKEEEAKSSEAYITSFKIGEWEGKITDDEKGSSIEVIVPYGTDVKSLVPEFEISDKATVDKASGAAQDFTDSVIYTVTAEDGAAKSVYTVTVKAVCTHDWQEATCTEPKTCKICKETEGEALGHDWKEATCTEPKTCKRCKETEGEALGHNWKKATCTEPKTCERCKITEGEALGHDWKEATCTEPKTCKRCKETEGEALGHKWKEATCTEPKTCERCKETEGEALGHDWKEATCTEPKTCNRCKATEGEALGHKWGAWKVTKKPTTKEGGLEERICERCQEKETRETPRLNIIGKPENNYITGIKEKGVYGVDEVINITAHGDGMGIENPIANDVRYVPAGWDVTSYFEWTKAPYKVGFSVKSEGNYQLEVSFRKQIYDGKNWINQKEVDVKKVNFTVSASKVVPVKTGDDQPIVPLAMAMILALLTMMIPVVWKVRKMSR